MDWRDSGWLREESVVDDLSGPETTVAPAGRVTEEGDAPLEGPRSVRGPVVAGGPLSHSSTFLTGTVRRVPGTTTPGQRRSQTPDWG